MANLRALAIPPRRGGGCSRPRPWRAGRRRTSRRDGPAVRPAGFGRQGHRDRVVADGRRRAGRSVRGRCLGSCWEKWPPSRDMGAEPRFKRVFQPDRRPAPGRSSALALQRCQSASWRRSRLVGRPCSMARAGSAPRRRCSAACSAGGDALGRFGVQGLRHRGRAAHLAQASTTPCARPDPGAARCLVAGAQLARGLAGWPLTLTRPLSISSAGQRPRLVEARGPQPLVQAQAVLGAVRSCGPGQGRRTMASRPAVRPGPPIVQRRSGHPALCTISRQMARPRPEPPGRRRRPRRAGTAARAGRRQAGAAVGHGQCRHRPSGHQAHASGRRRACA
jgi:hypothetical protein